MISNRSAPRSIARISPWIASTRPRLCGLTDALLGAIQHGPAQVDQSHIKIREALQQLERVIARTAADIEGRGGVRVRRGGGLRDQVEDQRRIDGRHLASLKVREPLDVTIKPLADLIRR